MTELRPFELRLEARSATGLLLLSRPAFREGDCVACREPLRVHRLVATARGRALLGPRANGDPLPCVRFVRSEGSAPAAARALS